MALSKDELHDKIRKFGTDTILSDIVILLDKANNSSDENDFLSDIYSIGIKEPNLLRKSRVEKFFNNKEDIEKKFLELVNKEENEKEIFVLLLTYIQDIDLITL